jgi:hypothetical protein
MATGISDATKYGLLAVGVGALLKAFVAPKDPGPDPNARTSVSWAGEEDWRVRIKVPQSYLTNYTRGYDNELKNIGGIIFPYTPSISFDTTANYGNISPTHSNYTFYSYRNSQIGAISISGRFSVENNRDALIYLSTVHLLRSLTKMKFGNDPDAGAPPPVCRLFAYGDYMLNNVPVAISSFKQDLPTDVDYYRISAITPGVGPTYQGQNFVPVLSTLSITLLPMYSRAEQAKFSVNSYINNNALRKGGFL